MASSRSSSGKKRKISESDDDSGLDRSRSRRASIDHAAMSYQNIDSEVKFLLEVSNVTKWILWPGECYIHWGYIPSPPTVILPGEKASITGHNEEGHYAGDPNHNLYATGVTGVVSWKIGKTSKKLAIMYSMPFNWKQWKNKLGIAIVDENQKIDKAFCRRMIVEEDLASTREFHGLIKPIKVTSDKFQVSGTMGTSHHCEIKITFMAKDEKDNAPKPPEYVPGFVTPLKTDGEPTPSTSKDNTQPEYVPSCVTPVKIDDGKTSEPTPSSSTPSRTSTAPPQIDLTGPISQCL